MDTKLKALIVDDEENARKLLHKLLEDTLYFCEIRLTSSVDSAINELNKFEPDLIFLDIEMPGKDGFSMVNEIRNNSDKSDKPEIVFVTAYDQYAIQAIKKGAFDYLLKPVNRKELNECIYKFTERINVERSVAESENPVSHQDKIPRIKVNIRTGTLFINPSSILFCKAEGNYTSICTGEKKYLCSLNIGKVKELLPGNAFVRLGRSLIINFEYITLLDRKECMVTLVRDKESVIVKIPHHHLKDLDLF
jgi:two-component system LytT family response regulator